MTGLFSDRVPRRARLQRTMESIKTITTHIIMVAVSVEFRYPRKAVSGFAASFKKLSNIERHPAIRVVVATKASGVIVIHAYFARPEFIMTVVPTHRAIAAR